MSKRNGNRGRVFRDTRCVVCESTTSRTPAETRNSAYFALLALRMLDKQAALWAAFTLSMLNRRFASRCCITASFLWLALKPAIAATPESEALVHKGNEAFRRDRAQAISLFTQAIAADPSNILAYYNRGRVQDAEGRR